MYKQKANDNYCLIANKNQISITFEVLTFKRLFQP